MKTVLSGMAALALAGFGTIALLAASASANGAMQPGPIGQLEPGLWQLRDRDGGGARARSLCVADPSVLFQVAHRGVPCARTILSSNQHGAVVHYTCPAAGFGRTALRVETPRLAKIDTQGISGSAPFAYRLEARRLGACRAVR